MLIDKNALENVVCEMAAILSRGGGGDELTNLYSANTAAEFGRHDACRFPNTNNGRPSAGVVLATNR